jgi:beta-glucanase (GH16 family)
MNTSTATNTVPQTYLTLRTTRLPTFQSTAEIENEQKNLLYASLRFRARIVGAPGAVAGLFTYFDDTNESDVEILTSDPPTKYRFTNQPATRKGDDVPGASIAPSNLPSWNDWRTHRIDWLPGMSRWYVDGQFIAQNNYSVPRKPSGLVLNMWSDGGVWSGNMSVGASAELQVQWVQVVFNTSGKREGPGKSRGGHKGKRSFADLGGEGFDGDEKGFEKRGEKGCKTVCKVDGVEKDGFPQVAYVSTGATAMVFGAWDVWATIVVGGLMIWLL